MTVASPQLGAILDAAALVGCAAAVVVLVLGWVLVRQARRLGEVLRDRPDPPPVRPTVTEADPTSAPELRGMLAKLDSAQRLNARQFQLQRSQFDLFKRMRGDQDPRTLAASILEYVGDYYEAPAGAFYLARPGQRLELAASYGVEDDAVRRDFRMGQGVVGRAALRRRILLLNDLEPDHLRLETALGSAVPRTVIVAPFHFAGQVKGVLELGTTAALEERDLDFLKLSAESVAMALDSARSRARVHRLLEETRRQAAVLARQQKELQATNEQLARSDRYKSEFLANMSHELRTPLNSMLIMSQVLTENRGGRLTNDELDAAATINKAGRELLVIINDILDMSLVESGKLELNPATVDPRVIAGDIEDLMRPVAERAGLAFDVQVAADVTHRLVTDRLRVNQVLKNLLGNAIKFTHEGAVELRVGPPDAAAATRLEGDANDWLTFAVRDTGIGLDAEVQERIFEVFQQGDGSIARSYGGSGLGLSISRSLAELLGGVILVDSRPGEGSVFTLCLPLRETAGEERVATPAAAAAPAETVPPAPPVVADDAGRTSWRGVLAGRRVLLADQDMRTVYAISELLDAMGARVAIARTAAEYAQRLEDEPQHDIVLVSRALWSPHAGGTERAGKRAGVLLCADPDQIPYGCDWPVLTRPVRPARLAELCRGLLASDGAAV